LVTQSYIHYVYILKASQKNQRLYPLVVWYGAIYMPYRPVGSLVQRGIWSHLEAWSVSTQRLYSSWETAWSTGKIFWPLSSEISKLSWFVLHWHYFSASVPNHTLSFLWSPPQHAATGHDLQLHGVTRSYMPCMYSTGIVTWVHFERTLEPPLVTGLPYLC